LPSDIKRVGIEFLRDEFLMNDPKYNGEKELMGVYEILEGTPDIGQIIPVRMHLAPLELG